MVIFHVIPLLQLMYMAMANFPENPDVEMMMEVFIESESKLVFIHQLSCSGHSNVAISWKP